MRATKKEIVEAKADQAYWQSLGDLLGLRCWGFTFRQEGAFEDAIEPRGSIYIPGFLADRILSLKKEK